MVSTGLFIVICLLAGRSSALEGLITPGDEFQSISCNQIISDSTIDQNNAFSNLDYQTCVIDDAVYDAGDRLYKLEIGEPMPVEVILNDIDGVDLVLVLLSNTIDPETMVDCPDTCITFSSSGSIDTKLDVGTYWIVVDGTTDQEVNEGHFELSINCSKSYTEINCGEIVSDSTINRVSNFEFADFMDCFTSSVNTYEAGDQLYRLDIEDAETIDIELEKLDNPGLHLFLLSSVIDMETGDLCPGPCINKSDTGSIFERISLDFQPGVYWLVVDGNLTPSVPSDIVDEGNFTLSIDCSKNISTIACGDMVEGSTSGRLDTYGSGDYATCSAGDYTQGDVAYEFELVSEQEITINLTPTEADDLDVVLMSALFDEESMIFCPDTCIAIGAATTEVESIQMQLAAGTYFIVVDGLEDAGGYMLELMCAPLPIQLVQFAGAPVDGGIEILWETASELSFEGFYLQRSQLGNEWTNVDWIDSKGGPSQAASYQYVDKAPFPRTNFYRLKSIDLDGTFEWSNIIRIDKEVAEQITLFPSPAHDHLIIDGMAPGNDSKYFIRSSQGQLLGKGIISISNNRIDISGMANGALFLTISGKEGSRTYAFQKM